MNKTSYSMNQICEVLELEKKDYFLQNAASKEQAQKTLDKFKSLVKKQYRALTKKYHPDLPSSGKYEEERMKDINLVVGFVKEFKIIQRRPPRQVSNRYVFRQNGFSGFGKSFTSSSSSSSSFTFYRSF